MKIKTYINFLKKSGKVIYGFDNIEIYKKKAYMILCEEHFSRKQKLIIIAKNLNCKLFETSSEILDNLLETSNCKVVLFKNYELVKAILLENESIKILREVNLIESNTKQ